MGLKQGMTPLGSSGLVDRETMNRLLELSISTVEELVGQAWAEPDATASYLGMTRDALDKLLCQAEAMLAPAVLEELRKAPKGGHVGGAVRPSELG